jgi:hypothetical protein
MDVAALAESVARCRAASSGAVRLVPGLEIVTAERYHLLAFGLAEPVPAGPVGEMAGRVREAGGVPVLAHPSRYRAGWEDRLAAVGAVEVWNRHYDGRVAPWPGAVAAVRAAPGVRATFGLDAHGEEALVGRLPELLLDASGGDPLDALRTGRYATAVAGRPFDPLRPAGVRALVGRGYRAIRRGARRIALAVGVPEGVRKRVGRRW